MEEIAGLKEIIGQLTLDRARLIEALRIIEKWELPPSGRNWDDGRPMSFGAAFGSNGERDYMRSLASVALDDVGVNHDQSVKKKSKPMRIL